MLARSHRISSLLSILRRAKHCSLSCGKKMPNTLTCEKKFEEVVQLHAFLLRERCGGKPQKVQNSVKEEVQFLECLHFCKLKVEGEEIGVMFSDDESIEGKVVFFTFLQPRCKLLTFTRDIFVFDRVFLFCFLTTNVTCNGKFTINQYYRSAELSNC